MLAKCLLFELFFSAPFLFATMEDFDTIVEEIDEWDLFATPNTTGKLWKTECDNYKEEPIDEEEIPKDPECDDTKEEIPKKKRTTPTRGTSSARMNPTITTG